MKQIKKLKVNAIKSLVSGLRVGRVLLLIGMMVTVFVPFQAAHAAQLTGVKDLMTNEIAAQTSNHTITFTTPTGMTNGQTFSITWGSFVLTGVTASDVTVSGSTQGSMAVAADCTGSDKIGYNLASQVMTFTLCAGDGGLFAASEVVTITFAGTNKITNPAAGSYVNNIAGTQTDRGSFSDVIITNDVVSVSAIVDPSLTFTISANALYFGAIQTATNNCWAQNTDPGDVACPTTAETEAFNMTAGTNATSGYVITITNTGAATTLTSGANTITAIGASAAVPAAPGTTEQFGFRMNASGGSGAVDSPYGTAGQYALDTAAFPDQIAHANGPSALTTYSTRWLANITAATEAGNYSASYTFIATATF